MRLEKRKNSVFCVLDFCGLSQWYKKERNFGGWKKKKKQVVKLLNNSYNIGKYRE